MIQKTVAITKEQANSLVNEYIDLSKIGLDNAIKERKHYTEVNVVDQKLWFLSKIRHQINELKNVKNLGSKEYKLQNKCSS